MTTKIKTIREVDIGLDISTSIIGVCVLLTDGTLEKLDAIKLTSTKLEDHYQKADVVSEYIQNELSGYNIRNIYVEEAHMRFSPGFSSAKTLFSLANFNGIVCHMCYTMLQKKPIMIGVRTARKALGIKIDTKDKSISNKDKVFIKVVEMQPSFPWRVKVATSGKRKGEEVYEKLNYDMADAWVIVRAGQLLSSK